MTSRRHLPCAVLVSLLWVQAPAQTVPDPAPPPSRAGEATQPATQSAAQKPVFQPSGMQGTTAPSGYAAGVSEEDTDRARSALTTTGPVANLDCSRLQALAEQSAHAPDNLSLLLELGDAYLQSGRVDQALPPLRRAHALDPANRSPILHLAAALNAASRQTEAVSLLLPLTGPNLPDAHALRLLGEAQAALGQSEQAILSNTHSLHLDPSESNTVACGEDILKLSPSTALPVFEDAAARYPDSAHIRADLGASQIAMGHQPAALRSLLRASDLDPESPLPIVLMAGLHGLPPADATSATARIQAYLVSHPDSAQAHYSYALTSWKQQTTDRAQVSLVTAELRQALALNPAMLQARRLLGIVEEQSGDPRSAAADLQQVIAQDPSDAEAQYRLARASHTLGNQQQSQMELNTFLRLKQQYAGSTELNPGASADAPLTVPAGGSPCPRQQTDPR